MTEMKIYEQARLSIPAEEFPARAKKLQSEMENRNLDLIITHSCECESASVRYLSNFWPVFDFAGVVVPKKGDPVLLTGGPESFDFASKFSRIKDVRIHPSYVESNAPIWDKHTSLTSFAELFNEFSNVFEIKRIGLCNSNLIPFKIMDEIREASKYAEFILADDIFTGLKSVKSASEIALLKKACGITEAALIEALAIVKPGVPEWQVEAAWRKKAYEMGAEGTAFPIWVTSGDSTYQSLCRSTDRVIQNNDIVQLTFGSKYNGYCGTMCRPVIIGKAPREYEKMYMAALEAINTTISGIRPGVPAADIYDAFSRLLNSRGYGGCALYGPAHGTGLQECEGPWIDNRGGIIIKPGMVLNVDIWIAEGIYGVRFEDCVLVTGSGIEELTSYRREMIRA